MPVAPYTVTNSYKGGLFMRTYSRNVRRAWDGDDYRAPKRPRFNFTSGSQGPLSFENASKEIEYEDSLERAIRETSVAAFSSSPSRKNSTVFSAESADSGTETATFTPPSSPPPVQTLQITPPNIKPRKPTFAALDKSRKEKAKGVKRKHDTVPITIREDSEPLSELQNIRSRPQSAMPPMPEPSPQPMLNQTAPASMTGPPPAQQKLVQTVLDLGQSLSPVTCSGCGMSYTPSLPEDAQLHDMYHNRHKSGIELGKAFLKSAMKWCYEVPNIKGSVVVVDRKIAAPGRKVVKKVLDIVNKELGSVDIPEDELWSQRVLEGDDQDTGKKVDRYKVFLHVIDGKCVAVCLTERISRAFKVKPAADRSNHVVAQKTGTIPETTAPTTNGSARHYDSAIEIEDSSVPAIVGVSRIWTSQAFRRLGIANNLLECVMSQFIYGMEIERSEVAFSQPTEGGASLARSWYGENHGWLVYKE